MKRNVKLKTSRENNYLGQSTEKKFFCTSISLREQQKSQSKIFWQCNFFVQIWQFQEFFKLYSKIVDQNRFPNITKFELFNFFLLDPI